MPGQIKRLIIFIIFIVTIYIVARTLLYPDTFGELGHFRASSIETNASKGIKYAGHQACADCHDDIAERKGMSFHRNVNCEACHGPGQAHIESDAEELPLVPRKREYCVKCHIYNPAKPTGFPQIDPILHNPVEQCITCHDPHVPDPPSIPGECSACHANISRTKALSPHAPLKCIDCHDTPDEHRDIPRLTRAKKPSRRADCGKCHDKSAENDRFVPRISLDDHYKGYLCWQCHYPHYPESRR